MEILSTLMDTLIVSSVTKEQAATMMLFTIET